MNGRDQVVVDTEVELPRQLALHSLEQGSWPWTFDYLLKAVARYRELPVDPVLLFWPLLRAGEDAPSLADGDTAALPSKLFSDRYELRIVGRRIGEQACRTWPLSRDLFAS